MRVRARNALGVSAASNEVQVVVGTITVPVPGCPGAPRSLTGAGSVGTVTLSWLPPLSGSAQSSLIEAGSSSGAANLAAFNNGPSTTFTRAGVPPGVYYLRVRAVAAGCPPGAASNEVAVTVSGASAGNPLVRLTLVYTCNPCSGDPDNYELNVDCVNGRCMNFRTPNATRSGTVTATVSMAPGVHNVEVVSRSASFVLTVTASPPGRGGMIPGSWRILDPPGGRGLSLGACGITGTHVRGVLRIHGDGREPVMLTGPCMR